MAARIGALSSRSPPAFRLAEPIQQAGYPLPSTQAEYSSKWVVNTIYRMLARCSYSLAIRMTTIIDILTYSCED
jgi:hypothetical protein